MRYPNIEEALFGEEGRAKQISCWYRELMGIISDNERFCEETQEIRARVCELFAKEEWKKIRYMPELFGKMELQLLGRSVLLSVSAEFLRSVSGFRSGLRTVPRSPLIYLPQFPAKSVPIGIRKKSRCRNSAVFLRMRTGRPCRE